MVLIGFGLRRAEPDFCPATAFARGWLAVRAARPDWTSPPDATQMPGRYSAASANPARSRGS
jgi:hypothetical protein